MGSKIYAIGGYNNNGYLNTVQAYDTVANAWTAQAPMPTARYFLAVAGSGGNLYAIGGSGTIGSSNTVEAYDPVANAWTTKTPMPTARNGLAAAGSGGNIYVIGGYFGGYLSTVEEVTGLTGFILFKN